MTLTASPELARLEALARYTVADGMPEEAFTRVAQLAAQFFRAPVALVNFVTSDSTWSRACVGVDLARMDRQLSFCARTIEQDGVLVSPDLARDSRFLDHVLVRGPQGYRFYAGAPLRTADGFNIGTLCVLDWAPRPEVTVLEREALANLAALAMDELELRRARLAAAREVEARQRLVETLRRTTAYAETLAAVATLGDLDLEPGELARAATALLSQVSALDWAGVGELRDGQLRVEPVWQAPDLPPELLAALGRTTGDGEGLAWRVVDGDQPLFVENYPARTGARPDLVAAGLHGAVIAPLGTFEATRYLFAAVRRLAQPWTQADRTLYQLATRTVAGVLLRREREQRLAREAARDPLTGLGNRRALAAALQAAAPPVAAAMIDLDGFKRVNDREGHARGDVLLRLFAGACEAELPPGAALYRLGGDEFVVLYPALPAGPSRLSVEVRRQLDAALTTVHSAGFGEIGASFGVASWPAEAPDPQAALALADERMYAHKRRPGPAGA